MTAEEEYRVQALLAEQQRMQARLARVEEQMPTTDWVAEGRALREVEAARASWKSADFAPLTRVQVDRIIITNGGSK